MASISIDLSAIPIKKKRMDKIRCRVSDEGTNRTARRKSWEEVVALNPQEPPARTTTQASRSALILRKVSRK